MTNPSHIQMRLLKMTEGLMRYRFDLAGLRHRLECFRESLPSSPYEDAMLEGEIPTDLTTEMKLTLTAVVEDQLNLAYENLLHAAGYCTERRMLEVPEAAKAA